jgi:hypothetical protein
MWEEDTENLFGPRDELLPQEEEIDPRAIYVPPGERHMHSITHQQAGIFFLLMMVMHPATCT